MYKYVITCTIIIKISTCKVRTYTTANSNLLESPQSVRNRTLVLWNNPALISFSLMSKSPLLCFIFKLSIFYSAYNAHLKNLINFLVSKFRVIRRNIRYSQEICILYQNTEDHTKSLQVLIHFRRIGIELFHYVVYSLFSKKGTRKWPP